MTVPPEELIDWMTTATGAGIACAIHAIGDRANTAALDAFALTGATGTIEHAQLVAHADLPQFARLGVAASLQPEHALDDRDLSDREWAAQTAMPYPMRSLLDADANLLFGSDAPVSLLDPWVQISAAVARTNDDRTAWHPEEALSAAAALAASTAGGTDSGFSIEIGDVADLIVVGATRSARPEMDCAACPCTRRFWRGDHSPGMTKRPDAMRPVVSVRGITRRCEPRGTSGPCRAAP